MGDIITIGRRFGSGGREVGKRLADELGFAYYDKQLLESVAEQTGLAVDYIEQYSEAGYTRNYPYAFGRAFVSYQQSPAEKIQLAQIDVIKQLADKGPCVIVGRCSDYFLSDSNPFNVFINASNMECRLKRCYDKVPADKGKSENQMKKEILSVDKTRAKYYEFSTGQKWGDMQNYHLCVDTSLFGIKNTVDVIKYAFLHKDD